MITDGIITAFHVVLLISDNLVAISIGANEVTSINNTLYLESFWDVGNERTQYTAIQAGEPVTFICRVWQTILRDVTRMDRSPLDNDFPKQSVYLYCPLSVAYCAQDCLLVDTNWPIRCTKQVRTLNDAEHAPIPLRSTDTNRWQLQEVIYSVDIATVGTSGKWSCSYGGAQSISSKLSVRDRPALLSFTSSPPSPVISGTTVNLTCRAAPSPNSPWYNFIWRRLGTRIPPAHSTLRLSDTVSVLTLPSAQFTDDGRYSCLVVRDSDSAGHDNWNSDTSQENHSLIVPSISNEKWSNKSDPALLYLDLDVYHAPLSITFSINPLEPQPSGSTVTLICHVNGGKPTPRITFYRLPQALSPDTEATRGITYFNSSTVQSEISVLGNTTQLRFTVRQTDHKAEFGCSATSVVISGRMLSQSKELLVLFPPGPPILTATPHGSVSENRTRLFICRASSGSYPVARVLWKLQPAVDYAASLVLKRSDVTAVGRASNVTADILSDIVDFEIGEEWKRTAQSEQKDPDNLGIVAVSEARLTSRPWFNGARVSCQLDWSAGKEQTNQTNEAALKKQYDTSSSDPSNASDYATPASLTTEVFFAPSAISLTANPLNGIRESDGEQVLECATTSAFPAAKITWLRKSKSSMMASENVALSEAEQLTHGTLGARFDQTETDDIVQDNVTVELLPGVYGGKRVVSRLVLANLTRSDDGTVFICKVTHIEWTQPYGRIHRVVVLYPPDLSIKISPETWPDRMKAAKTHLQCVSTGGRPLITALDFKVNHERNRSQHSEKSPFMWEFTWLFRPTYPENLWSRGQTRPLTSYPALFDNSSNATRIVNYGNQSNVFISYPGRKHVGEYTCLLQGPGGTARSSVEVNFIFPPELVPSGQTAFTSSVGSMAVLELYVWSFPYPLPTSAMRESYSTPTKLRSCDEARDAEHQQHSQSDEITFTWYKVDANYHQPVDVVRSNSKLTQPSTDNPSPRIRADVILVNLASIFTPQFHAFPSDFRNNSAVVQVPIPTLIYRLIFDKVLETDYGNYICEIDHWTGKWKFLANLQPPVDSTVLMKDIRFSRSGSVVHLRFEPSILRMGSSQTNTHSKESITSTTSIGSSTKRDIQLKPSDRSTGFAWMLIRICVLIENMKPPSNRTTVKAVSCSNEPNVDVGIINQIQPDLCIDRVVDNPERGIATILLDKSEYYAKLDWKEISDNWYGQVPVQNASRPYDPDSHTPPIRWDKIHRVAYQLRFYDKQGRLAHYTNWFHEDAYVISRKELAAKTPVSVVLPVALGIVFLVILVICAFPLVLLIKRRKRKQEPIDNIDNGCLSLKNPLGGTPLELFQTAVSKHDDFYVANTAVVDSPCSLLGRTDPMHRRILMKTIPGLMNGSDESMCSPHGSFQILPSKRNAMCVLEKTADGQMLLTDRSISPLYTPIMRRGSVDEHHDVKSLLLNQRPGYGMTNSFRGTRDGAFQAMNAKQLSATASHCSAAATVTEQSMNQFHAGPHFIYNKCFPNKLTNSRQAEIIRACQTTRALESLKRVCPDSNTSISTQNDTSPMRELSFTNGEQQPMSYSHFQTIAVPMCSTQSERNASPYMIHRPTIVTGVQIQAGTRPICTSQLMQRREISLKDEINQSTYDTGSLKMPLVLPNIGKCAQPMVENNHYHQCQYGPYQLNNYMQPLAADSVSQNSSEMGASQDLCTPVNMLSHRCKTEANNNLRNRPVGIVNDMFMTTVLNTTQPNQTSLDSKSSETAHLKEGTSRTPYDNELLDDHDPDDDQELKLLNKT